MQDIISNILNSGLETVAAFVTAPGTTVDVTAVLTENAGIENVAGMDINTIRYTLYCRAADVTSIRAGGTLIIDGETFRVYSINKELETAEMLLTRV